MNFDNELLPSTPLRDPRELPAGQFPPENEFAGERQGKGGFGRGVVVGIGSTLLVALIVVGVGSLLWLRFTGSADLIDARVRTKVDYLTGLIHEYFYEDVDEEALRDGIYKGVLEGLDDPYSEYYTAKEYEDFQISTTGNYAGIGAQLSQDKNTMEVTVAKVYDNSPAQEAGLHVGDRIISVDGIKGTSEELSEFVQRIRGEAGTTIELVYSRNDKETTVKVTRAAITIPSVSHTMLAEHVGLIEISEFSTNTKNEFDEAVAELTAQGMEAVIFDLRTNPGGMVDSVTEILDEILPEGTTVYMLDKKGEKTTYTSDEAHKLELPTAVLTSGNTASAAEIFAGAIRDFEWGTLIGEKTYGKGVVQSTFPLSDGSAIKLTIASYYTPSGESIHKKGIEPDIELALEYTGDPDATEYDYMADNQVAKALEVLQAQ